MALTSNNGAETRRGGSRGRAEGFPVRQWLKLGAASAGVSAALWGFSLLGPEAPTAAADSGDETSVSPAGESAESGSSPDAAQSNGDDADDADDANDADDADDADTDDLDTEELDVDDVDGIDDLDLDGEAAEETAAPEPSVETAASAGSTRTFPQPARSQREGDDLEDGSDDAPVAHQASLAVTDGHQDESVDSTDTLAASAALDGATATDEPAAEPVPAPPWLAPRRSWNDIVADTIEAWTNNTQAWIESLSVSEERKAELTESFWNLRRTFFNQAPTVAPVQISGLITGPIDGTIGAVDADGDEIVYRVVRGPRQGTVAVNPDGTYIYTPDADFDGVDTFNVIAIDRGFHVNLLSLLRPIGTRASLLINQSAITFDFNYTDDGTGWTAERRQALEDVATQLLWYFRVNQPVTLTYTVGVEDDDFLASAGSDQISERAGFWRTVVQNKLQTGVDSNGAAADGEILWNFAGYEWGLGDTVASGEYDFVSTAIHELMHSFGFLSAVNQPGSNTGSDWTRFDRFVVTSAGVRPISSFYRWRSRYDELLTDEQDGLYFGGPNAIAVYGGLVPLYTPDPWEPGSSMHHLDDLTFTGADQMIMNAETDSGLGLRVFSAVELAILADLGYQVVMPESPPYAAAGLVFVLLGGRRRRAKPAAR